MFGDVDEESFLRSGVVAPRNLGKPPPAAPQQVLFSAFGAPEDAFKGPRFSEKFPDSDRDFAQFEDTFPNSNPAGSKGNRRNSLDLSFVPKNYAATAKALGEPEQEVT